MRPRTIIRTVITIAVIFAAWSASTQYNKEYFFYMGRRFMMDNKYQDAINTLNVLLRFDEDAYEGYFLRGIAKYNLDDLLGADTDFVEVFSAAGRAFADGSTVSDALNDAYTAVFGTSEIPAAPAVSRSETLPDNVEMLQRVLDFDYVDPVSAGQITSLFGCRSDPLEGDGRFHYGLDIAGEEGAVIRAFADGTVTAIGSSTDLGSYVTVTHAGGFSTLYAHCRKITASDGQQVRAGDPIAEMGDTGRATGFHLHFELHQDDTYLNPIYYVTFA